MKYAQQIGMIAALLLIGACFLPWTYIESRQLTISGFSAAGTNFGKPGLFTIVFTSLSLLLFATPRIWAKRLNVFIGAVNLAWAIRNYILISSCMLGECPVKKPALYALVVLSALIQAMALFPRLEK